MIFQDFHNGLRLLLNVDKDTFEQAVNEAQAQLPPNFPRDAPDWPKFKANPFEWFIRAPTAQALKLWVIMQRRRTT